MPNYLGIDLGTTGLKAVLADERGNIQGSGYCEYPLSIPSPGYAEQDPEAWYAALCAAVPAALRAANAAPASIKGIGFSGQMHGLVMLDAEKRVLAPAIIHCDGRAAAQKKRVMEAVGMERLGQLVQNQVHSGFQALSLMWVRENRPELYAKLRYALLPKDYLRFRLCGELSTEPTDACSTLMYDGIRMRWSRELLSVIGVDEAILPDAAHLPYEIAGRVTARAAMETGLAEGTPVAFGGGDQPMQAVGNGLLDPGQSSLNLGTSGQLFVTAARPVYDPQLRTHTFCHAPQGVWYVMGAVLNACLAANWFNEKVLGTRDYVAMHAAAQQTAPGAGGLVFLPYLTGERTPHMNERARGAFIGLTLGHTRAEMERAVLEGVAYSLRDSLEIIRGMELPVDRVILSGGGARSAVWGQIMADVLGMPLYATETHEEAALGAIICAQVACGEYASLKEACAAEVRFAPGCVEPRRENRAVYDAGYEIYRRAYASNAPLFEMMAGQGK